MPREDWTIEDTYQLSARKTLEPGMTFKVSGEHGATFRFRRAVTNAAGETWIDCYGGGSGYVQAHSFSPDRITVGSVKAAKEKKP